MQPSASFNISGVKEKVEEVIRAGQKGSETDVVYYNNENENQNPTRREPFELVRNSDPNF
jgi:hypothetical protein